MPKFEVVCDECGKKFYRDSRRVGESKKFNWKTFCSREYLAKNRRKYVTLICSRSGCGKTFLRTPSQMKGIKLSYCSTRCAAICNNTKKVRTCQNPNCGKQFTGTNRKYCSYACIPTKETQYTKEKIVKVIKGFYKSNSRLPVKREMAYLYREARNHFGTWNKAVIVAGFIPNPVLFANKHVAKDGHICDSVAEMIVDNWLTSNKIIHKQHVYYPNQKRFKTDFLVKDKYWIEFFGLSGEHQKYDKLRDEKLQMIKSGNLDLIQIFPIDLFPKNTLANKLGFLASKGLPL